MNKETAEILGINVTSPESSSAFWGRACTRAVKKNRNLQSELDECKAENKDLQAGINCGADRYAQLRADLDAAKEKNKRLRAAVGLALVLEDVESIKEVLQPWKGD